MSKDFDCLRRQMRGGWAEDEALERCSFPIGPRNTWSNAAYPLAGLVLYAIWSEPAVAIFALCMIFLGVQTALASGFIAGETIIAVIVPILVTIGILHLR